MKFMKLGSKPDAFQTDDNNVRFVASDLPSDIVIYVGDVKFHLHKFPLLSKSYRLHELVAEVNQGGSKEIHITDFPGGPKAFEMCAKFCYGMTVTLNAYNVVAARCAAEHLQMTEDVEKGNLTYKIEVFLTSSILRSWKDSIIVLQTTKSLLPWSEELNIVGRCVDSIASKTSVEPSLVNWSYSYSKRSADQIVEFYQYKNLTVPNDWWVEDLCELDIDLYKRVMVAIKSRRRMSPEIYGEALEAYAVKWLPDAYDDALISDDYVARTRCVLETVVWLLPKAKGCSCRFLLKLLTFVVMVEADDLLNEELMSRISSQLHEATVTDLLIPAAKEGDCTTYDIDLVRNLVGRFLAQEGTDSDSLLSLGKLIDGYLAGIACDSTLAVSSFVSLAELLPEPARPLHDGLYTAIDTYLKKHPTLTKDEKKSICGLMDVKKFSQEASIHAAQNNRLPLRVVVQVLFFQQLRVSLARTTENVKADWGRPALKKEMKTAKLEEDSHCGKTRSERGLLLGSRSRRIFDKLWSAKGHGENNRSSDTSGSSQSPPSSSANPLEASKSSGSSWRNNNRRHSVS